MVYHGRKLLSDVERGENTPHVILYAMDAKTGKVLYLSGDVITVWVHFAGSPWPTPRFTPWITIRTFIAWARPMLSDKVTIRTVKKSMAAIASR